MPENAKLTAEQSKVVRELKKAVDDFGYESAYTSDALRKRVAEIVVKFRELEALFPQEAKAAKAYYEDVFGDEPDEDEQDGYGEALFNVLLDLHAFYDAESFTYVVRAHSNLSDDLYSLATFSDEFSVDRGCWLSELV